MRRGGVGEEEVYTGCFLYQIRPWREGEGTRIENTLQSYP